MKLDSIIIKIYQEIEKETNIPTKKIDKILTGYFRFVRKIMTTTANGRFNMTCFGFLVFDEMRSDNKTKPGQRNKIDQLRKADKVISIYELTGIKRRNENA